MCCCAQFVFDRIPFDLDISCSKNILDPKFFWINNFLTKIFLDQNSFGPNVFEQKQQTITKTITTILMGYGTLEIKIKSYKASPGKTFLTRG